MCRLFGQIAKKPEDINYWFFDAEQPFKEFSEKVINRGPHNSGWGIAYIEHGKWKVYKEGKKEFKVYNFDKIREIKSTIILCHLRHGSSGEENTLNAHPFSYKNWVFEHNGGVDRDLIVKNLNGKFRNEIKSETDSEAYFLLIMQFYEKTKNIVSAIKSALDIIRQGKYRGLNFIMSDGKKIYVFRGISPEHLDMLGYYCLNYLEKADKIVISSDPLTKDNWISIKLKELVIIEKSLEIKRLLIEK
jgi:glutamine amidotransferase